MAAQISHVVYADKALKTILKDRKVNEKDYFLGTLFPDIRYLAGLSRQTTHLASVSIDDLNSAKTDFELGYLVHTLVDLERDSIVNKMNFLNFVESNLENYTAIKYVEDYYNYLRITEWNKIIGFIDGVSKEELTIVDDHDLVLDWHQTIRKYLSVRPCKESITEYLSKTNNIVSLANYEHLYQQYSKDRRLKAISDEIYKQMYGSFLTI